MHQQWRIHFAHFEFNFHLGLELSESKSRVAALVMAVLISVVQCI